MARLPLEAGAAEWARSIQEKEESRNCGQLNFSVYLTGGFVCVSSSSCLPALHPLALHLYTCINTCKLAAAACQHCTQLYIYTYINIYIYNMHCLIWPQSSFYHLAFWKENISSDVRFICSLLRCARSLCWQYFPLTFLSAVNNCRRYQYRDVTRDCLQHWTGCHNQMVHPNFQRAQPYLFAGHQTIWCWSIFVRTTSFCATTFCSATRRCTRR